MLYTVYNIPYNALIFNLGYRSTIYLWYVFETYKRFGNYTRTLVRRWLLLVLHVHTEKLIFKTHSFWTIGVTEIILLIRHGGGEYITQSGVFDPRCWFCPTCFFYFFLTRPLVSYTFKYSVSDRRARARIN